MGQNSMQQQRLKTEILTDPGMSLKLISDESERAVNSLPPIGGFSINP